MQFKYLSFFVKTKLLQLLPQFAQSGAPYHIISCSDYYFHLDFIYFFFVALNEF